MVSSASALQWRWARRRARRWQVAVVRMVRRRIARMMIVTRIEVGGMVGGRCCGLVMMG